MSASRQEADKDGIVVPTTIEEYCIAHKHKPQETVDAEMTDFYDDDDLYGDDFDDDDDEHIQDYNDDNEDSGNGESWCTGDLSHSKSNFGHLEVNH